MRFKKVKVNQTKLCWNEQDLYFHQKTIREYSVKHDSFFHTCLTFCKYVWEKPNLCVKYRTCSFWHMFGFYPTCLEKTNTLVYLHLGAIFHTCFLMCFLKFLFAENLLSQSSQYTSTCVVLCFSSLSWLGKDFGLLAHLPRVYKNILDLSVLCINLTWFTKYSLTIVLYGHSSQWNCWLLIWFSLWTFSWITSLFSVWQILPHSLHDHIFPILKMRFNEF